MVGSKGAFGSGDGIGGDEVEPLTLKFIEGVGFDVLGLGGEATRNWSVRRSSASAVTMSGTGSSSTVSPWPSFFIFCGAVDFGRQSLTAAVMIRTSHGPNKALVWRCISAAVTTG